MGLTNNRTLPVASDELDHVNQDGRSKTRETSRLHMIFEREPARRKSNVISPGEVRLDWVREARSEKKPARRRMMKELQEKGRSKTGRGREAGIGKTTGRGSLLKDEGSPSAKQELKMRRLGEAGRTARALLVITLIVCHLSRWGAQASQPDESQELENRMAFSPTRAPANRPQPERGFKPASELDLFLDDINHNELGQLASGRPVSNPFGAQVGPAAESKQLQTSQSQEAQIYSECALILQRTYVKNVDDPK